MSGRKSRSPLRLDKYRRKKPEPPEPSVTHAKPPLPRRKPVAGGSVPQSTRTSCARSCAASAALQVYPSSQEYPEVLPSVRTVLSDVSRSDPAQTVYLPPSRRVGSVYHPAGLIYDQDRSQLILTYRTPRRQWIQQRLTTNRRAN